MTQPSNFIFNSDYLTIAQVSTTEPYTVFFPPQQFPSHGQVIDSFHVNQDIPSTAIAGAIDRIMIEYNGNVYVANKLTKPADPIFSDEIYYDQFWILTVYRKNKTTLTARCSFFPPTQSQSIPTSPSLTFKISATSFKAPNVLQVFQCSFQCCYLYYPHQVKLSSHSQNQQFHQRQLYPNPD